MKIIHFADLHLGVESYGHIDPASGLSTRFLDFLDSFDQMVDYALKDKVNLVLFCGDAYKSRDPSQTQQREFAKRIKRLSSSGIPVFLLTGNHDLPNATGRATTTEIFDTLAIENVFVANRPCIQKISTADGFIQVAALPWLKRSAVVGKEEAQNLSFAELNQKMQDILAGVADKLAAELDPTLPSVLAAHVWVQGARVGSEEAMSLGQEHMILPSAVAKNAFDYVALGHIHRHQVLAENPPMVYAGSLERLDFSDEGDDKGFYLVDIEIASGKRWTSFEFHTTQCRRFLTIKLELQATDPAPTETVLQAIGRSYNEICGNIVRLEISLSQELEGQLREDEIRNLAREAYYFAIVKQLKRELRPRLGDRSAEEMTPVEALRAYVNQKSGELPLKKVRQLLEHGQKIIRGSDDS